MSLVLGGQEQWQRVSNSCHLDGCDSVTSVLRTFCKTFQRKHEQELCGLVKKIVLCKLASK